MISVRSLVEIEKRDKELVFYGMKILCSVGKKIVYDRMIYLNFIYWNEILFNSCGIMGLDTATDVCNKCIPNMQ